VNGSTLFSSKSAHIHAVALALLVNQAEQRRFMHWWLPLNRKLGFCPSATGSTRRVRSGNLP